MALGFFSVAELDRADEVRLADVGDVVAHDPRVVVGVEVQGR